MGRMCLKRAWAPLIFGENQIAVTETKNAKAP